MSDWNLIVQMPDGSEWAYPVMEIARNRAAHYADEFGGDVELSLAEDTLPLFRADAYEIEDWAANNMNEDEIAGVPVRPARVSTDRQEGWVNGYKRVEGNPPAARPGGES